MKKIVVGIVIAAVLGVTAYVVFGDRDTDPKFKTEKITRGPIQTSITATGTVNPVINVLVGTQVSGTIKKIYVDFNSPVKQGQVITLIDPATFDAQVAQARANLQAAKANYEKARAADIDAKRTMGRNKELLARNLIAQSDFDTASTNYDSAKAQVVCHNAQIAQAEASLKTAEINLAYTRIVSPVDGTVVSRNVDVGQTVAASFQTPTLFTIAKDLTKMQIDSNVAEADIGKINVDQPVEFTVDAYPDITFKGRVSEVRNAPITVQNVVTYDVVVKVDNSDLKLRPGMTANISIIVADKKDVLRISNAALRFKLSEEGKGIPQRTVDSSEYGTDAEQKDKSRGVWILENKTPRRVKIATGISNSTYTELLPGDLKEGQDLIVESLGKHVQSGASGPPRMF